MDFIQQLQIWVKGDVTQGKMMVGTAIVLLLPVLIGIMRSSNTLLQGMLIPVGLLLVMNLGYGSYLLLSRPKALVQIETQFRKDPEKTMKHELTRAKTEDKSYGLSKSVWAVLMVISAVLYFVFTKNYYKGLALGLIGMFFGMLIIDAFLHDRVKQYLTKLDGWSNFKELPTINP
ncbi:hypothetical protein [Pedobacter caeni]|uniref:Uncharacterized protein n=1 Tax=Pedobacter caeni TaxID=288992 RepID=A0A1M4W4T2_9SPHI|nr:hypothetical protein [Pedobacter caeni]SHE76207.1 hypothetical protein SAMN04488522_1011133 [Pedobacter caeni]